MLKTKRNHVELYPNPATNELLIKMDKDAYSSYTITNQLGQSLIQRTIVATQTRIAIRSLPAGMYYISFRGDNGSSVQKFIKQ